jgi:hypothetical protein
VILVGVVSSAVLAASDCAFIRRFLIYVLPKGFHRIHHYGLFANTSRAANIAGARELLAITPTATIRIDTS